MQSKLFDYYEQIQIHPPPYRSLFKKTHASTNQLITFNNNNTQTGNSDAAFAYNFFIHTDLYWGDFIDFPIPGAVLLMAVGLSLLICSSTFAATCIRFSRGKYFRLNKMISWLENRSGERMGAILRRTRPSE